jgi:hypothetical protein
MEDPYASVREILSVKDISTSLGRPVQIHHVDITCDGCESEPIIGKRFHCKVCEDIDLCETCTRGLFAARIEIAKQVGELPVPGNRKHSRPRNWISRIKSENSRTKWSALQESVPCLHPSHVFEQIISGPERAVVYTCDHEYAGDESFRVFLDAIPPSKTSCQDAAWIHCSHGELHYTSMEEEKRIMCALDEWDRVVSLATKSKSKVKAQDVDKVATKYMLKHGKWMIFPSSDKVDAVWSALSQSLCNRELGSCTEIKVSTRSPTDEKHVLLAYTEDYSDEDDVQSIARAIQRVLKEAGVGPLDDARMLYKPDIYTHLGVYSKNPFHLKPTIYTLSLD